MEIIMRPIIINVDYKHNPNKIYNISNKVTLKNKIVNIANKNIELNYKKEIISNKIKSDKKNIESIDNIDLFSEIIREKNVIYTQSQNKILPSQYINLIKNHRKTFIPTGNNDHTIVLCSGDLIGKGVYGAAYRIGNFVIKIPNDDNIQKSNKNTEYSRCSNVLNEINRDNDFSRGITLKNGKQVLITKYVDGKSITGKNAFDFVKEKGRILFDYGSEGNVKIDNNGKKYVIDVDFVAQATGLKKYPSLGTLTIHEFYKDMFTINPLKTNNEKPFYYSEIEDLLPKLKGK